MNEKPNISDTDKETSLQEDKQPNLDILPDTDPKPRDFIRMFAWLFSIGAVLAAAFIIPAKLEDRNRKNFRGK